MLFSIIVPVYNTSKTIRNCLNSILHQSLSDYEVIIINDGSSDNSEQICKEYTKKYSNFKLYSFENQGVSISRKRGISLSSGKYIVFVDSDDTINTDLLKNIATMLLIHPNLDVIRYQANIVNDDISKNHDRYNYKINTDIVYNGIESLKHWSIPNHKYALYWLFAFKRSLFVNIEILPNLKCYEDLAYIPLLIASAKEVITIDYCGYNYYYGRSDSLTNDSSTIKQKERVYDFCKACQFAVQHFCELNCVNEDDILFFKNDFQQRQQNFFNNMNPILKTELTKIFNIIL